MKIMLVVLCLVLAGCDQLKPVSTTAPAVRYQLVSDTVGHVWKIDTVSGEVWLCGLGGAGDVACHITEQTKH